MNFLVTQNGKELDKSKYSWDEKTKVFSTNENNLVIDFSGCNCVTFTTGYNCTFATGYCCTFTTSSYCTFNTGDNCTFKTGDNCTFKTGDNCTFDTGDNCFVTRWDVKGCDEIPVNKTIKLNNYGVKGYTVVEKEINQ